MNLPTIIDKNKQPRYGTKLFIDRNFLFILTNGKLVDCSLTHSFMHEIPYFRKHC